MQREATKGGQFQGKGWLKESSSSNRASLLVVSGLQILSSADEGQKLTKSPRVAEEYRDAVENSEVPSPVYINLGHNPPRIPNFNTNLKRDIKSDHTDFPNLRDPP